MKEDLEKRIKELEDKYSNPFDEKFDYAIVRYKIEELRKLLFLFSEE